MANTCLNCPFWERRTPVATEGECRVNPPRRTDTHDDGLWPVTQGTEWCGQHPQRKRPLLVINRQDTE